MVSSDEFFEDFGSNQPFEPFGPLDPLEPLNLIRRRPMPKRPFERSLKAALEETGSDLK